MDETKSAMFWQIYLLCGLATTVMADFPGLRRPPTNWNGINGEQQQQQSDQEDDQSALLAQIGSMIEHHARMRLLQHLAQISREKALAEAQAANEKSGTAERNNYETPFAYTPDDPRYYLAAGYIPPLSVTVKVSFDPIFWFPASRKK